jgi:feruloyl esterase
VAGTPGYNLPKAAVQHAWEVRSWQIMFSFNDTTRWFRKLQANSGGAEFARYYPVPGMAHCSGGPVTDQFDALGALVDWVEQGKAQVARTASVNPDNKELPSSWSKTRTRPLFPWPQAARYLGGDLDSAASFGCAAP